VYSCAGQMSLWSTPWLFLCVYPGGCSLRCSEPVQDTLHMQNGNRMRRNTVPHMFYCAGKIGGADETEMEQWRHTHNKQHGDDIRWKAKYTYTCTSCIQNMRFYLHRIQIRTCAWQCSDIFGFHPEQNMFRICSAQHLERTPECLGSIDMNHFCVINIWHILIMRQCPPQSTKESSRTHDCSVTIQLTVSQFGWPHPESIQFFRSFPVAKTGLPMDVLVKLWIQVLEFFIFLDNFEFLVSVDNHPRSCKIIQAGCCKDCNIIASISCDPAFPTPTPHDAAIRISTCYHNVIYLLKIK
jgi:hypothetical protein